MADNYLENHQNDYLAYKARKEKERLRRRHAYLVAYRKRLAAQRADKAAPVAVAKLPCDDTTNSTP